MNWTPEQVEHYRNLSATSSSRSFRQTAALCFDDCEFSAPAKTSAVSAAEKTLGCAFPDKLKQFYSETDGVFAHYGEPLIMALQRMVAENNKLRGSSDLRDLYMPFDHMLVFGGDGGGNLFFFPIRADGSLAEKVFRWDHESDSRSYYANGLQDFFLRYATNLL